MTNRELEAMCEQAFPPKHTNLGGAMFDPDLNADSRSKALALAMKVRDKTILDCRELLLARAAVKAMDGKECRALGAYAAERICADGSDTFREAAKLLSESGNAAKKKERAGRVTTVA